MSKKTFHFRGIISDVKLSRFQAKKNFYQENIGYTIYYK